MRGESRGESVPWDTCGDRGQLVGVSLRDQTQVVRLYGKDECLYLLSLLAGLDYGGSGSGLLALDMSAGDQAVILRKSSKRSPQ